MLACYGSFCDISSDHVGRQFVFGYGVKNGYLDVRVKTFSYFCGKMGVKVVHQLRGRLSNHLQRLSLSNLNTRNTGEIVERVMGDTNRVRHFFNGTFCSTFNQVFYIIGVVTIIFFAILNC